LLNSDLFYLIFSCWDNGVLHPPSSPTEMFSERGELVVLLNS